MTHKIPNSSTDHAASNSITFPPSWDEAPICEEELHQAELLAMRLEPSQSADPQINRNPITQGYHHSPMADDASSALEIGLLLRYIQAPPMLMPDSKARISEDLWGSESDIPSTISSPNQEQSAHQIAAVADTKESKPPLVVTSQGRQLWHTMTRLIDWLKLLWQTGSTLFVAHPAWGVATLAILLFGSFGLYHIADHYPRYADVSEQIYRSQQPNGSQLFNGAFARPQEPDPFLDTRSASQRLAKVYEQMNDLQRDRWLYNLQTQRLGPTQISTNSTSSRNQLMQQLAQTKYHKSLVARGDHLINNKEKQGVVYLP
jgi:hypothetical protein